MKRKFFSLAIVLMLAVSVLLTAAGMPLFAGAETDVSMDATNAEETAGAEGGTEYVASDGLTVTKEETGYSAVSKAKYSSFYFRDPVDLTKKAEFKFTVENLSDFLGKDFWVGVFLGKTPDTHSPWQGNALGDPDAFGILIGAQQDNQLGGQLINNAPPAGSPLLAAVQDGENSLVFEVQRTKLILSLNGVSMTMSVTEDYFTDHNGYLSLLLNNQSFSDADAENTCVNLSFRVVNDTVVKIPQIALKDSEGAYTVQQGEDIEIVFEGDDPFVSVTGNGITEADYTADAENGTVTISQDFLKLLTVNTELTFSLNGEQSSVSFTVKIEPTEGFVQIMTSAREFIYDKASLDNLEIGITGDAFVSIDGNGIQAADWQFAPGEEENSGTLTINKSYFSRITNGEYVFTVTGENSSIDLTITLKGQPAQPLEIALTAESGTFDGGAPDDIVLASVQGVPVNVVGNVIMAGDFSLEYGKITISKDYLATLKNGEYTFRIYEEEGSYAEYKLTVVNSTIQSDPVPGPQPGDTTPADDPEKEEGGCNSSVGGVSILLSVAVLCAVLCAVSVARQKSKKENR